jgi:L-serine dehydratase
MAISAFDMFKIGPSSSHTVGPMRAARQFLLDLEEKKLFDQTTQVVAQLYGSLALTGKGHGTDKAVLLGLEGETPDEVDPDNIGQQLKSIRTSGKLKLLGKREIVFDEPMNLLFHKDQVLPKHSNGLRFTALDGGGKTLLKDEFYSIGGGFIIRGNEDEGDAATPEVQLPYQFTSAAELLQLCKQHGLRIDQLMLENEKIWRTETETRAGLLKIWQVMQACVQRGMREPGELPGGLHVSRRRSQRSMPWIG